MAEEAEKTLKIRFRFPGGEEFEAQGTLEFIERQRNYFLDLIGKKQNPQPKSTPTAIIAPPPHQEQNLIKASTSPVQEAFPARRLWEKLLKEEGDLVLLRRKMRLEPQEAALLLLAGARVLLNQPTCKALSLSQMLQNSGFTNAGRLDRLLQKEANNGYLESAGSKRGRTYQLTNAGFARAFVLAEKLAGEML
uniref:Uncharacterized protein n=1 Tax=uncultured Elusimicrobia bacterium TaxID=699876 RepID=A0A650ELX1_9BACT|nr:hypothetical protein Elusimicrob1349_1900 [uncultured Elusimicrobia bacterium]